MKITFSSLNERALPLLYKWFQVSHVKRWYARGDSFDLDKIREKYLPRIQDKDNIPNFIVKVDGEAIGYIQLYRLSKYLPEGITDLNHNVFKLYNVDELAGIDLFIGKPNWLHKGFGRALLTAFINKYIKTDFKAVVVDPQRDNKIAIEFFKRFGFKDMTDETRSGDNRILILELNE